MKERFLKSTLWVPKAPEELFPFFSNPQNLDAVTPPWLHFQMSGLIPERIQKGSMMGQKIKLHGVPIQWLTEITEWNPPHEFVDTQRKGPYAQWIHRHTFEP